MDCAQCIGHVLYSSALPIYALYRDTWVQFSSVQSIWVHGPQWKGVQQCKWHFSAFPVQSSIIIGYQLKALLCLPSERRQCSAAAKSLTDDWIEASHSNWRLSQVSGSPTGFPNHQLFCFKLLCYSFRSLQKLVSELSLGSFTHIPRHRCFWGPIETMPCTIHAIKSKASDIWSVIYERPKSPIEKRKRNLIFFSPI